MSSELIKQMLRNPPDPDEALPTSNRSGTIYGTTVPFLVVSWVAVTIRLWMRYRIVKEPGWDDFFVVLAAACNTTAKAFVWHSIKFGLGRHFLYIGAQNMSDYFFCFYMFHSLYVSQTALIKISLLLQYLRIFKTGRMRWLCLSLLITVILWGLAYSFAAWVPCFPVKAFWQRALYPNAICYGYAFTSINSFIAVFESHAGANMVFDIIIFVTPLVLFKSPNLKKRNLFAMAGVFFLGVGVILTSVWRLYTLIEHRAATYPYVDFTWWSPVSVIVSCLEIDIAITCASIPIFWPIIERSFSSLSAIFVTQEVKISEDRRSNDQGLAYELEHVKTSGDSVKSSSGISTKSLTREATHDELAEHYKDQYVLAAVDPLNMEDQGVHTDINSGPRPKWRL